MNDRRNDSGKNGESNGSGSGAGNGRNARGGSNAYIGCYTKASLGEANSATTAASSSHAADYNKTGLSATPVSISKSVGAAQLDLMEDGESEMSWIYVKLCDTCGLERLRGVHYLVFSHHSATISQ